MTLGDDLTKEEIAALSMEMQCCYFLYPWNNSLQVTTVCGWAYHIGFYAYINDGATCASAAQTAEHEANELIEFVNDVQTNEHTKSQVDCAMIKSVAMLAGHTSAILIEECATRADKIEELQHTNQTLQAQLINRQSVIDRYANNRLGELYLSVMNGRQICRTPSELDTRLTECRQAKRSLQEIIDTMASQIEELERVNTRLMHKAEGLEDENCGMIKTVAKNDGDAKTKDLQKTVHNLHHCIDCIVDEKRVIDDGFRDTIAQRNRLGYQLAEAESKIESDKLRLELLDDIEKIVNPVIKSGEYAHPAQSGVVLAQRMWDVCHTVIDFRRKYSIIG